LGEIENVLVQHGNVREAVVLVREDHPGDKRLAAYLVKKHTDTNLDAATLQGFLREKLPEYMMPSAFVFLEALPLSSNGKVDRKALMGPEAVQSTQEYTGPRSAVEEVLVGIWGEALWMEEVSVHDSFFELGGHSLLATQVISRVQETFRVSVPLRTIFDAPTIASFAKLLLLDQNTRPKIEDMAEKLVSLNTLSEEELEERLNQMAASDRGLMSGVS